MQSGLFLLLALAAGLGQGSLHVVLPALGDMSHDFSVTFGTAQLSLTAFMVSMAVTTLIAGFLADRFGRRPVFLAGLVLLILGGTAATFAPSIWLVIAGRVVQGAGAVSLLVIGRAIMRDRAKGAAAARGMSWMVIGQAVGPALAPIVGSLILYVSDWRGVMALPVAIGLGLVLYAWRGLQETGAASIGLSGAMFLQNAQQLLLRQDFWAIALIGACTLSMFFSIISSGSWAVSEMLGLAPGYYAVLMLAFSVNFILGNFINARVVERFGQVRLITFGAICMTIAILGFQVAIRTDPALWIYLLPCGLFAFSNGFILANSIALAVDIDPKLAGTASGIVTCCHMVIAGIVSQIVGVLLPNDGLHALAATLLICGALMLVMLTLIRRRAQALAQA